MKLVYPQHLKWVLLCGLLLLFKLDASLADVEGISEVTAPNITSVKEEAVAPEGEINEQPLENLADRINDVPLSPDEDVDIKSSDLAPPEGIRRLEEDGLISLKDSEVTEPEKSERTAKNIDTPSVNAVASDIELLQEDQAVKKQINTTETPDEKIGTTKPSQDDSLQFEYPPKGRTLSYKDNATNSDNSDVLKNTVPSEPKAVKIEENQDKEGDRWIKKQKGISSSSQTSRLNKERNLSGSYLPGLAALNTVNRTSLSEPSSDKFIKYQRRKRPWSAQQNSSNLSIPEETTVWSLASLKSTPKEKPYGDVKPIVHWSTIPNKPTTEYQPKLTSPTPVPLSSDFFSEVSDTDSDWVGISKLDISDVPSIKVTSTSTDVPVKLIDANFTSPSSSINLIDNFADKEVLNETSKILETQNPPAAQNESKSTSQTLSPEFSNVINESDSSVKPLPSTTTHSAPTTEENVKHLSIYPSPFSNSVNELHEEEDIVHEVPSGPDEPKYEKNKTTEKLPTSTDSYVTSSTQTNQADGMLSSPAFNNSNHPNISQMFSGKNSYADGFNFSTTPSSDGKRDLTTKPENNSVEFGLNYNTTPYPAEVNNLNISSSKPTEVPVYDSTNKIAHVTSTMLPNKIDESSEKTVTQIAEVSSISLPHSTESEFNIGLTDMFNMSHTPDSTFAPIPSSDKSSESINNSTTSQPKEFNEILLDVDKSQTTTEKSPKPISTTTVEAPIISSVSSKEETTDFETQLTEIKHKANQSINFIELSDATEQTTLPKAVENVKEMELTSIKNDVKFLDLFNTTDSIILSTVSKYPGLLSTSDKVPLSTTEETHPDSDEDVSTFNQTLPSHPKPTKELEHSTEIEDKTPDIFSDEGNTTKPTSDITPKYSITDNEPSRTPANPEPTHTIDIAIAGEDEHEKFPLSEEDTIYDTADPIFTRLLIQANDKELCSRKEQLRDSIIRLFKTNGSEIHRKQVVINNLGPKDCLFRNPPSEDGLFPIQVYLTNSQGHNDLFLTDKFIDLWQREGLDFTYPVKRVDKVIGTRKWVGMDEKSDNKSSIIAAIVISTIAGVCLLFIVILLVIIRKRQKRITYGQRCTPVSLEDYSLDNISVYNSTRRKAARASKRSYGNPAFDDPGAISHVVNFSTLANFFNNRSHIDEEFSQIPTVSVKPDELPPGVETKNRFANVIPIPETRVILNTSKGINPDVDTYINANFVKGAKGEEKFYIACQAPMPDTISDFWQMIWEQQSRLVIMLTDLQEGGVEKCADYLPPSEVLDCHRVFGDLQVTLKKREVREKYVISNLQLKNLENNLWREVVHLWLTCWPPQGIPSEPTAVIAFLIEARSYIKSKENTSPIVVHCSPGTGRTGTIIAIDICIRDFEIRRTVDVPRTVCNIRKDRAGAVQTKDQYAFIYQVLHLYATKLTGGGLDSI